MVLTKTLSEIVNELPYEMPTTKWVIHDILDETYCLAECPVCHIIERKTLRNILYSRPDKCLLCSNKEKRRITAKKQHPFSIRLNTDLLTRLREKVDAENLSVTCIISELIEGYLDNRFKVRGRK